MKNTQGFTLLELLFAIAIVGILGALAVPAFNSTLANSRLTANTNHIVGILNLARSEAIRLATPVIAEPDGSGGYQVRNLSNNEILRTADMETDGLTITPASISVTYQGNGYRTFGGGTLSLQLCNDYSRCRTISVSSGGGVSVNES